LDFWQFCWNTKFEFAFLLLQFRQGAKATEIFQKFLIFLNEKIQIFFSTFSKNFKIWDSRLNSFYYKMRDLFFSHNTHVYLKPIFFNEPLWQIERFALKYVSMVEALLSSALSDHIKWIMTTTVDTICIACCSKAKQTH